MFLSRFARALRNCALLPAATSRRALHFALAALSFVFLATLFPSAALAEVVRTGFSSITAASTSQCLDIYGGSTAAGAAAIQWPCNQAKNEQWTVQLYSANAFRIIEQATGDCLVVSGGSLSAGVALHRRQERAVVPATRLSPSAAPSASRTSPAPPSPLPAIT